MLLTRIPGCVITIEMTVLNDGDGSAADTIKVRVSAELVDVNTSISLIMFLYFNFILHTIIFLTNLLLFPNMLHNATRNKSEEITCNNQNDQCSEHE